MLWNGQKKLVRWLCTTVYQSVVLDPASIKGVEWATSGPFFVFAIFFLFWLGKPPDKKNPVFLDIFQKAPPPHFVWPFMWWIFLKEF